MMNEWGSTRYSVLTLSIRHISVNCLFLANCLLVVTYFKSFFSQYWLMYLELSPSKPHLAGFYLINFLMFYIVQVLLLLSFKDTFGWRNLPLASVHVCTEKGCKYLLSSYK